MQALINYIIQAGICSGILYGYYHFFLRNKKFHQYNRFYLMAAIGISLIVPLLKIPLYFSAAEAEQSIAYKTLKVISGNMNEEFIITQQAETHYALFTWQNILKAVYLLIASIFLIRFIIALLKIRILYKKYPSEKIEDIHFINTTEQGTPFSFFKFLFWNNKIELDSDKGQKVFRHEWFHIRQRHSLDILFTEAVTLLFWVNPFFHLIKRELKAIHEFLADEFAINETESWEYAELLLQQALQTQQNLLVNPFFHNQIKRRIAMITLSKKPGYQYVRKLMVLPLAAAAIFLLAFTLKEKDNNPKYTVPITIVLDAGHGGTDDGAESIDKRYSEASISLDISKVIKSLAKEYNVNVIMTRENENFPDGTTEINEGLKARVDITNKVRPDAFISIHLNSDGLPTAGTTQTGFEAYISNRKDDKNEIILANSLLQNINAVYKTDLDIKRSEQVGIWVLDQNKYPAVLLQCGYITNPEDVAFITNKENQEKIARKILEGIREYAAQRKVEKDEDVKKDTIPEATFIKPVYIDTKNKVILEADSIIYIGDREKMKTNISNALLIINDEPASKDIFRQKAIISQQLLFYPENNIETIKKFGKAGQNGVIVFQNPIILNIPNSEYYRNFFSPITDNNKEKNDRTNIIFLKTEIDPSYPGGAKAWREYLGKNLDTKIAEKEFSPGKYTFYVKYLVKADSTIAEVKTDDYPGSKTAEQVLSVMKNSGK